MNSIVSALDAIALAFVGLAYFVDVIAYLTAGDANKLGVSREHFSFYLRGLNLERVSEYVKV
jgi:hypothetical protein